MILRRLTEEGHDHKIMHWAIQKDPKGTEERFWFKRNVVLFDAPLEEFVERLRRAL